MQMFRAPAARAQQGMLLLDSYVLASFYLAFLTIKRIVQVFDYHRIQTIGPHLWIGLPALTIVDTSNTLWLLLIRR
jgi:hypothetical protein